MACFKAQWFTGAEWGLLGFYSSKAAAQRAAAAARQSRGYKRGNVRVVRATSSGDIAACAVAKKRRR